MNPTALLKLIDYDGETIDDERMLKAMIEKYWGDLFCMSGDATHGSKKEIVEAISKYCAHLHHTSAAELNCDD